ncbi:MAG TPA: alpha/beta hydrolase-fold protein [Pyrinomonadaceae bacterium]|nr:alpha/beta hydrolase-fold protein [Pyrinomonadaceae bacterium]
MRTVAKSVILSFLFITSTSVVITAPALANYRRNEPNLQSPRLMRLAREIATVGQQAVNTFVEDLQNHGTPLIEPIPDDQFHVWVTFFWLAKEPVRNVVVFCGLTNYAYTRAVLPDIQMARLDGTDIWFKTFKVRKDARFTYQLSVDDSLVPEEDETDDNARRVKFRSDPLNPHHPEDALGKPSDSRESLVELSGAPPQLWIHRSGKPAGELKRYKFQSEILKNERDVTVYFPPGYNTSGRRYPLLIFFDGEAYTDSIPTPTILDNLIASRKIPPVVAVFVNNPQTNQPYLRTLELSCNPSFTRFVVNELLPWVRQRYHITNTPADTAVGGASRGGLAAACAALDHPEIFGNVFSQSGFFVYKDKNWFRRVGRNVAPDDASQEEKAWAEYGSVITQFVTRPKLPIRFYLEAGVFENTYHPSVLIANRHLRDVLLAKGYSVGYEEFAGHHSTVNFRGSLATALIFIYATR